MINFFKPFLAIKYASISYHKLKKDVQNPVSAQKSIFRQLIKSGKKTLFGRDHSFAHINGYEDFKNKVPIREYEEFKPYIEKIKNGENDILWTGRPIYLAKTSGTTSGTKYIPLTRESIKNHIRAARKTLLNYIYHSKNTRFVNGKMIFLQGSPKLSKLNNIFIGRLSGIVAHHIPFYLQKNRLPSYGTNCIEDWETKLSDIVKETLPEKMTLISGIPPWVKMYFEKILAVTGKTNISEVFPSFSLFVHGGVNYEPYRNDFVRLIGKSIDVLETYPASEGFIAFQDDFRDPTLLLNVKAGMFFEFVKLEDFHSVNPQRINIENVEIGINYVLLISSNTGLWAYNIGDTIKFTSFFPHKIMVTGRVKHFISAFGEHLIVEEIESTLSKVSTMMNIQISEFTVAPYISQKGEKSTNSCHEWFIESNEPKKLSIEFAQKLDELLQQKNIYYKDLREGNILQQLKIRKIKKGSFIEVMKKMGRLGGQNKIPHVQNDRNIANRLTKYEI